MEDWIFLEYITIWYKSWHIGDLLWTRMKGQTRLVTWPNQERVLVFFANYAYDVEETCLREDLAGIIQWLSSNFALSSHRLPRNNLSVICPLPKWLFKKFGELCQCRTFRVSGEIGKEQLRKQTAFRQSDSDEWRCGAYLSGDICRWWISHHAEAPLPCWCLL